MNSYDQFTHLIWGWFTYDYHCASDVTLKDMGKSIATKQQQKYMHESYASILAYIVSVLYKKELNY